MKVKAEIKDNTHGWEEVFEVGSLETAKNEIDKVIESFNNTLRPGETKRDLVKIIGEDTENEAIENEMMFETVEHIVVGKNIYGNYRALKLAEDKNKDVLFWIDATKIKHKNNLLKLTQGEFEKLKFKCKNPTATAMCFNTEFVYIQNDCQRCPLLFRYANSHNYNCRFRMASDKKMIYDD